MNNRVNDEDRVFAVSASGIVTVFDRKHPDSQEATSSQSAMDEEPRATVVEAHA